MLSCNAAAPPPFADHTKQEQYTDDAFVQRNTTLTVRRVPASSARLALLAKKEKQRAAREAALAEKDAVTTHVSGATEAERLAALLTSSKEEWTPAGADGRGDGGRRYQHRAAPSGPVS